MIRKKCEHQNQLSSKLLLVWINHFSALIFAPASTKIQTKKIPIKQTHPKLSSQMIFERGYHVRAGAFHLVAAHVNRR